MKEEDSSINTGLIKLNAPSHSPPLKTEKPQAFLVSNSACLLKLFDGNFGSFTVTICDFEFIISYQAGEKTTIDYKENSILIESSSFNNVFIEYAFENILGIVKNMQSIKKYVQTILKLVDNFTVIYTPWLDNTFPILYVTTVIHEEWEITGGFSLSGDYKEERYSDSRFFFGNFINERATILKDFKNWVNGIVNGYFSEEIVRHILESALEVDGPITKWEKANVRADCYGIDFFVLTKRDYTIPLQVKTSNHHNSWYYIDDEKFLLYVYIDRHVDINITVDVLLEGIEKYEEFYAAFQPIYQKPLRKRKTDAFLKKFKWEGWDPYN